MSKIRLLSGIFKEAQNKGKEYLLYLNADRLLAPCYEAIGLEPKDKRYGGWEEREISGHSLGHYLSALSYMYVATEDEKIKEKLEYTIDELGYLQDIEGSDYVSGFKRDCFDKVFSKTFNVTRFELGGSWVPWYSIHKIYSGLLDSYKLTNNKKALEILIKLSNWAKEGLNNLSEDEFDRMLYCEHGGMCEVMGDLYEITKDEDYLNLAIRFIDKEIIYPLMNEKDELEGKHANTQIPKILGAAKLYDITKEEKYRKASEYFWHIVTSERSYAIGGNSIDEHFGKIGSEALGVTTAETCNTYNMLKLTEYLYKWNKESKYMDYYEKALYNHILASQDPVSGMKTYFVSTKPGHFKVYCSPDNSFWCCTGTGMENPGKYTKNIYYLDDNSLYINLFISSSLEIEDKNIKINQITDFPREEKTKIIIEESNNHDYEIKIRVPYWINNDIKVMLNNNEIPFKKEKGYISISKVWQKGDTLDIDLNMNLHIYKSREDKNKVCFMYGPLVLAGALGRENFPESDIVEDHLSLNNHMGISIPKISGEDRGLLNNIEKLRDKDLEFKLKFTNDNNEDFIKLIPFYKIHHERYSIYFTRI
ncbi:glycoside hydrolase family 127 protein [Clostridium sp. AL.422]|uniref:glycoside hydrolase family 127 protein n=1 Tax=Clostridium TaxID=1485 RepID=UPI00293DC028|nr:MULTISPECIES: beta-L-arabinofuranosidase domain-containing protein [unclassified Clostridium]MDV4150879.1 glycoside hydrolase family 127 protein [Clostridium sp. AL.422]